MSAWKGLWRAVEELAGGGGVAGPFEQWTRSGRATGLDERTPAEAEGQLRTCDDGSADSRTP